MILVYEDCIIEDFDYEFEPDSSEVDKFLAKAEGITTDDILDLSIDEYDKLVEYHRDALLDHFREQATEDAKEYLEERRSPLGYRGLSQNDFI